MHTTWKPVARHVAMALMATSLTMASAAFAKNVADQPAAGADQPVATTQEVAVTDEQQTAPDQAGEPVLPEMVRTQVPGYYRVMVGNFEVTALYDGRLDFHAEMLSGIDEASVDREFTRFYGKKDGVKTAVNAFLIHTGEHLVLVDAGSGQLFSPDRQGKLLANLKAAGYLPEQVDTIILTHLHGDNTGGLVDSEGQRVFPNATVYANRRENEYWLSEQKAAAAPVEQYQFFRMARETAVPYLMAEKWKSFEAGEDVVPGIRAVAAYGHTTGHTAFALVSDGKTLLIVGDIIHSPVLQFAHPEVAIKNDADATAAISSRKGLLKAAAERRIPVAGTHLPFPGIGYIARDGENAYTWVPVEYDE